MASCKAESQAYRKCLKEARSTGRKCTNLAVALENCREKWRQEHHIDQVVFDGTRVLPNPKCKPLNAKVQTCVKLHKGDQTHCQDDIQALQVCMEQEQGVVAKPTASDKLWSDYKGPK